MTLQFPLIHSNGTSRDVLLEQNMTALDAARALVRALGEAAPNNRDFYLLPGAELRAFEEHRVRLNKAMDVQRELEMICENISDQ